MDNTPPIRNFASFFAQAVQNRGKKIKKGKYKGQMRGITSKELKTPGAIHYKTPRSTDAPSSSTYMVKG